MSDYKNEQTRADSQGCGVRVEVVVVVVVGGGGGGGGGWGVRGQASQITGVSNVYSTVCSGADQRKHQSSVSLAFVRGIHRGPVNSPHKGPVTRKTFPFDDVIMLQSNSVTSAPCTPVGGKSVVLKSM